MFCNAMMFNIERIINKDKTKENIFLTFVDTDTGESFRTFVTPEIAAKYEKLKVVKINMTLSLNEYNGRTSLQCRITSIDDVKKDNLQSVSAIPKTA
jgi:hypothetical protein